MRHLIEQCITIVNQQQWITKLLGFNFEVAYKVGRENKVANAFSRQHEEIEFKTIISYPVWQQGQGLQAEVLQDPALKEIIDALLVNLELRHGYSFKNGVLLYKNMVVLSAKSPIFPLLLKEFHASPSGGHSGFLHIYRRIAGNSFWQGLKGMVQEFVRACDTCKR